MSKQYVSSMELSSVLTVSASSHTVSYVLKRNSCGMLTITLPTMERIMAEVGRVHPSIIRFTNRPLAVACEVLARRIVHRAAPDRLYSIMSTRYCHRQVDGDESGVSSALELAIDSQW